MYGTVCTKDYKHTTYSYRQLKCRKAVFATIPCPVVLEGQWIRHQRLHDSWHAVCDSTCTECAEVPHLQTVTFVSGQLISKQLEGLVHSVEMQTHANIIRKIDDVTVLAGRRAMTACDTNNLQCFIVLTQFTIVTNHSTNCSAALNLHHFKL